MGLPTERRTWWNRRSRGDIPPQPLRRQEEGDSFIPKKPPIEKTLPYSAPIQDTRKIIGATKEDKDRANAATGGLTDQQGVSTPVTLSLIGGAALVGGVGGWLIRDAVASENPSEISIDSFPNSFNTGDSVPEIIGLTEVSDNGVEKIVIGNYNIHFVDLEQAKQLNLEPVIDKKAGAIRFLFPFKIADSISGRIDLTPLPIESPPVGQALFEFSEENVSILAPAKAHVYLIRGRGVEEWGEDPNKAAQVRMYKYYEEDNTTVVWWFFDEKVTTERYALNPLLLMQDFNKEVGRGTNWEKLPVVDALTEVATTTERNQPVRLNVMAYRGKIVGPNAEVAGDDFLLKPQFFTTDSDGTEKILVIKK
ncbi:MAG: hypothetical protein AAB600_01180 [Patescibacteria group bacterium]